MGKLDSCPVKQKISPQAGIRVLEFNPINPLKISRYRQSLVHSRIDQSGPMELDAQL